MVHIAESTVGRRYAGWFLKNAEHAARVYTQVKNSQLPVRAGPPASAPQKAAPAAKEDGAGAAPAGGRKVAWASS